MNAHRIRIRHAIEMEVLGRTATKAGFDPNQLRDPHTGEWIDTPGLPSVHLLPKAGTPIAPGLAEFDYGLHGPPRTSWAAGDDKAAEEVLALLAETHKWPDKPAIPIRPIDVGTGVRGEFVQRGTRAREIRVQEGLGPKQTTQTLTHEMAHFLDSSLAGEGRGFLSEGYPSPAMEDFLRIARESQAMQTVMRYASPAEKDYLNRPREIWARAYAQWITGTGETGNAGSWDGPDFRAVGRAVHAVLEEQGLI